ncbi:hypothetical protein BQ8794_90224 [Mesorhizobium prunaredense]|uniref:Uncharacterized protein n=1 Tax=Mesorhizobium prunaredense TaxID=1631249 RepID=A0A1R3VJG6_9HYPH|nr:hypothetical protein BQ8794_90224 [Mesorhizobium prunaredense]
MSAKQKGLKSFIEHLHVERAWGFEKAGLRDDRFDCHNRCGADAKRQRRQRDRSRHGRHHAHQNQDQEA